MRAWALLAGLGLASCTQVPAVEERLGHHLPGRPTIVSLNPCSDAVLAEVADRGQLLAISHFSRQAASSSMDLAAARSLPAISGTLEEILALRPDMVIADDFLPAATADALSRRGIAVERIPIASTIAASKAQVMRLASLSGHAARGAEMSARIDAALQRAAPPAGSSPISAVMWQAGGIVPGDATLIGDLLRRTGFRNASAVRGFGQADYLPLETMLADPPRVILAAGNRRANEDRLLSHPALAALRGTRHDRFDPALLWCGGPSIIRAAARLAQVRRAVS